MTHNTASNVSFIRMIAQEDASFMRTYINVLHSTNEERQRSAIIDEVYMPSTINAPESHQSDNLHQPTRGHIDLKLERYELILGGYRNGI